MKWDDIELGSLVLASVRPGTGWFEAIVTGAKPDGELTLRWRDWPDDPSIERRSEHLALIGPALAYVEA